MARNNTAQAIEGDIYTLSELRWELARVRGKRLPERTLRFWIESLCIHPNDSGLYSFEDLLILKRLVLFLRRKRSISSFRKLLLKELTNYAD